MLDFKALLFDLDGTLVDTAPDFITAVKKQLEIRGGQLLDGDIVRTSVTHGSIGIIESVYDIKQDDPQFESLKEEFLELYLGNIAEKSQLFDGLQSVLENCKKHSIPWGIITNKPLKYTQPLLEALGSLVRYLRHYASDALPVASLPSSLCLGSPSHPLSLSLSYHCEVSRYVSTPLLLALRLRRRRARA